MGKKEAGLDEGSREEVRRAEKNKDTGRSKKGSEGGKKKKEVRESVPGMNIKM